MEENQGKYSYTDSSHPLSSPDPMVLGVSAFFIGFVMGSGRLNWLGNETGKIASSLGALAFAYLSKSFEKTHPNLFSERSRFTH